MMKKKKKIQIKKVKKIKKAENMKLFRGIEEVQQDILKEIFVKQSLFFNENNSNKKKELKNDIEELENNLIKLTLTENGNHKKLEEIEKINLDGYTLNKDLSNSKNLIFTRKNF